MSSREPEQLEQDIVVITREELAGHIDDPVCTCYRCHLEWHTGVRCNCPYCKAIRTKPLSTRSYSYAHRKAHWTSYRDPELRRGRQGRPYKRLKAELFAVPVLMCCRCGHLIDKQLHWSNPMAFTLDHIDPLANYSQPLDKNNALPAHRRCNLSAGGRTAKRVINRTVSQRVANYVV